MKGYKLHAFSINGRAFFIWFPEGQKPRISFDEIDRLTHGRFDKSMCLQFG